MNFDQQLQQWIIVDNQISSLNKKLGELRERRQNMSELILFHSQKNGLECATVTIPTNNNNNNNNLQFNDGKPFTLKFMKTKTRQPLTFRHLEKSLSEIIRNEEQCKQIINYVKQKRETIVSSEIRRVV